MTITCPECDAATTAEARWCGRCGAVVRLPVGPGRTRSVVGVVAAVTAIAGLLTGAAVLWPAATDDDAPPAAAIEDTRCDLDTLRPACAVWTTDATFDDVVVLPDLLVVASDGGLAGLDPDSGDEEWRFPVAGTPTLSTNSGLVLLATGEVVVGVDPLAGVPRWQVDGDLAATTGDGVVVIRTAGTLQGLDPTDGTPVWERPLDPTVYDDVRVVDTVVVARRPTGMQVFRRESGLPAWSVNAAVTDVHGVARDSLVVSLAPTSRLAAGSMAVYDLVAGARLWTRGQAEGQHVVVGAEAIFTRADNTPIERLDVRDGTSEWVVGGVEFAVDDIGPDLLARGVPVMADRHLQLLDPRTGEVLQESRVGRDGVLDMAVAPNGEVVASTPDGLHRFPASGPTRAEIDAIEARLLSAAPLLVDTGDRVVRVEDVEARAGPACQVGLLRSRCLQWETPVDDLAVAVTARHAVAVRAGALQGVDLTTGEVAWRDRDELIGLAPVRTIDDTCVLVGGATTAAVVARTGEVVWSLAHPTVVVPGLHPGLVAVRDADGLSLRDVLTGEERSRLPTIPDEEELVGLVEDAIVLTERHDSVRRELVLRDVDGGDERARRLIGDAVVHTSARGIYLAPSPAVGDEPTADEPRRLLFRHDAKDGALMWGQAVGDVVWSDAATDEPILLSQDGTAAAPTIVALEPFIGAQVWTRPSSPLHDWRRYPGGYVLSTAAGLDVVNRNGALVWQADLPLATIVSTEPLLVVQDGMLLRVDDPREAQ